MRIFNGVFLLLLSQNFGLLAQVDRDTILLLKEVVVEGNRLKNFTIGNKIQKIDSSSIGNMSAANLSDLLGQHGQIFIKSYGVNNLATVSSRGTGAVHTAVLWNGFNIQGPTTGLTDFSLISVTFLDDVYIQYGGAGALYGSGAVGGTVHLNSPARFDRGLIVGVHSSAGSFGNYHQALNIGVSKKRFVNTFRFFNHNAKNNFPFVNTALPGNPEVRQQNAESSSFGLLQENHLRIGKDQYLNLRIWIQDTDRQIPPPMTSAVSLAAIRNHFYRFASEWQKAGERINYFARTAYFKESLHYTDPESDINSIIDFQTSITEAESRIYIRKDHLLNVGLNNTYMGASSVNYPARPSQNRTAFFASYRMTNAKDTWKMLGSLRQELIDGATVPFTPSFGFEGKIIKEISINGNISRNYRVPAFNDLYWVPGGNPDLKPESGWSEEAGLTAKSALKSVKGEFNVTLFNSTISNWIIWIPGADPRFWSPQNVQEVWSRGLENSLKLWKEINEIKFQLTLLYSYVVSTNEKTKSENDRSLGKQLIYVPIYSGQGNLSITYKEFHLNYVHTYTGNRFTSTDNTEYVAGFQLGNVALSKNFTAQKFRVNLNARINNVWDVSYQAVQWQAMPGRNYQIGLLCSIKDK